MSTKTSILVLRTRNLFQNFWKSTGNFAVLALCAAAHEQMPKNWLYLEFGKELIEQPKQVKKLLKVIFFKTPRKESFEDLTSRTEKLKRESKKFKINRLSKYILIKSGKLNVINELNFAWNTKSFAVAILVFLFFLLVTFSGWTSKGL